MCCSNNHCAVLHSDSGRLVGRAVVCNDDFLGLAKRLPCLVERINCCNQRLLFVVGRDDEGDHAELMLIALQHDSPRQLKSPTAL